MGTANDIATAAARIAVAEIAESMAWQAVLDRRAELIASGWSAEYTVGSMACDDAVIGEALQDHSVAAEALREAISAHRALAFKHGVTPAPFYMHR